ncbi:MAG: polyphosphate kinase 2 family protein [Flavobacteriaceae bacterium]|nr:polyphosphate kinase 2 family protein [Flavobacteriaceae bacterium]
MNTEKYLFQKSCKFSDFESFEKIKDAKEELENLSKELAQLQDVMYADDRYSILICLQGMDTSGKDSLVREVFKSVNVNGVNVFSFKTPNTEELAHDYLWRHYTKLPERGKIAIFNRTHYENVLVTRVHPEYILAESIPNFESVEKITDAFYHDRMDQINAFEKHLVQNGTIVLKFFLHLSKDEQKNRLLRRLDKPEKNWKFSAGDLKERKRWDDYMKAYEDLLKKTSTDTAPWYVIPADHKDTARYLVARAIIQKLQSFNFNYPKLSDLEKNNLNLYRTEIENS